MKRRFLFCLLYFLVGHFALAADGYVAVTSIPIGGEGGWDILTIDPGARRLYLSHATKVVVVDIDANRVVGEIADTPGVHALLALPEIDRAFSTNGKENKVGVIDLKTLKTTARIDVGANPDVILAAGNDLYVFNHTGNSASVIDAKAQKVTATIPLDGSPEFAVADGARVYVNIEDKSEVEVIDRSKREVVARWPLAPGEEPTGIALDVANHRLFATCHNKMLAMLDTNSGKVVTTVPIGAGVDGCAFDDASKLVFASCGEGVTVIAKEETPDQLNVVQKLATQRGARTIALDPKTHRIYLPTADFEPAPSPLPGASPGRPQIVPNTFRLLVYETEK